MISKTNYRKWLNSDNEQVRNLAFQAAFVTGSVPLEDLVRDYPKLIELNLTVALKRRPELWADFIGQVAKLKNIPVQLVSEIVGMVSFYLNDRKYDFDEAFKLVDSYEPSPDEAGILTVSLMRCLERDDRWLTIALNKVKKINAKIEEPLLALIENSHVYEGQKRLILDAIMEEADYSLKAKIVHKLLQRYGNIEAIRGIVLAYLEKFHFGMAAFAYPLIEWLKDEQFSIEDRVFFTEKFLDLVISHQILLSQNQRKQFFAVLDLWLSKGNQECLDKLDRYLENFPNDAGKVFRLYNRVIVKICQSNGDKSVSNCNWFGFLWEKDSWVRTLIERAFNIKYIKAIRRYGEKNEQTEVYMLALHGALTTDDLIRKRASEILILFEQTVYLTGCINELLPQLENILQEDKSLAPYVNFMLDLLLVRDYPLNHVSVLDLQRLDDFCSRYALKANNFYEKFKEPLMDLWEKQNEEERIIDILKTELAILAI